MKSRTSLIISLLFIFAITAAAQSGKIIKDDAGYSFRIPKGFTSQGSADGYSLNEPTGKLTILVLVHPYSNAEQYADEVDLSAYGLTLDGEPKQVNSTDYSFKATGMTEKGAINVQAFAMFSPAGGGLTVLAMAASNGAELIYERAYEVFRSVKFIQPKQSDLGKKVTGLLKGKTIYKRVYRSGYSEEVIIRLCRDGSFYRRSSGSGGSGATIAAESVGTWKISTAESVYLVLLSSEGKLLEYELDEDTSSLKVKLNGTSYFVRDNNC